MPATLLAMLRVVSDTDARRVAGPALRALGRPDGSYARWRFAWGLCYAQETSLILGMQAERLTEAWALKHVTLAGELPPRGAILLTIHHKNTRLGSLRLRAAGQSLGLVAGDTGDARDKAPPEFEGWMAEHGVTLPLIAGLSALRQRIYEGRVFIPPHAARPALRWLQQGGSLVIMADSFSPPGTPYAILGREMKIPPGTIWLARQSSRPIVPFVARETRGRWEFWCGEPVPATVEGVGAAVEDCIRRAPTSWSTSFWSDWERARPWPGRMRAPASEYEGDERRRDTDAH